MADGVVMQSTPCDQLRAHTRVSRQFYGASATGNIAAAKQGNSNVNRTLYCQYDPRSRTCSQASGVNTLTDVRAVRGYTYRAQISSYRSTEQAIQNNVRRLDHRQRALCDRLAQQV